MYSSCNNYYINGNLLNIELFFAHSQDSVRLLQQTKLAIDDCKIISWVEFKKVQISSIYFSKLLSQYRHTNQWHNMYYWETILIYKLY